MMADPAQNTVTFPPSAGPSPTLRSDSIWNDMLARHQRGEPVSLDDYRVSPGWPLEQTDRMIDLIYGEFLLRVETGGRPDPSEYLSRFPHYREALERQFQVHAGFQSSVDSAASDPAGGTVVDSNQRARVPIGIAHSPPGYEILEVLGRGGMGIVYKARQVKLGRLVALKMILDADNADSDDFERFRSEATAIAELNHPHIVQIYEVGEFEDRPFFSLEYCSNGSLLTRVRKEPLAARDAAELILKLAGGVAAAHAFGIVHRDLKPANVLLADDNTPKLTDFGLAKRLDDNSGLTRTGIILGTPSYMPPEQTHGDHAYGPLVDVYALGAVLYECLTGRPPFVGSTVVETIQQVQSKEPVAPRLLQPGVPRDLETICLKCLQKDPARRYQGAVALAEDLARFLDNRPILARPIGPTERLWRWCRRNPAVAGLLGSIAVIVVVSFLLVYRQWQLALDRQRAESLARQQQEQTARENAELAEKESTARQNAERQEKTASLEAARAKRSLQFMQSLFKASNHTSFGGYSLRAGDELGQKLTARELLERGASQLDTELTDDPIVKGALLSTIGDVFRAMGLLDKARGPLEEAVRLLGREELSRGEPEHALALFRLGWLEHEVGNWDKALRHYEDALKIQTAKLDPKDLALVDTRFHMGWSLAMLSDPAAEALIKEALATRKKRLPEGHPDILLAQIGLAGLYIDRGDHVKALPLIADVFSSMKKSGGADLEVLNLFQQAMVFKSLGFLAKAEKSLEDCVAGCRKLAGDKFSYLGLVYHELGTTQLKMKKDAEAEKNLRAALEVARNTVGMAYPRVIYTLDPLGGLLERQKRIPEAIELLETALQANEDRFGRENRFRFRLLAETARLQARAGNRERAVAQARDMLHLLSIAHEEPGQRAILLNLVAVALDDIGEDAPARELYDVAITVHRSIRSPDAAEFALVLHNLGLLNGEERRYADAVPCFRESAERLAGASKLSGSVEAFNAHRDLGRTLLKLNRPAEAEPAFRAAVKIATENKDIAVGVLARAREELAGALIERGKLDAAVPVLKEAAAFQDKGEERFFEDGLRYLVLLHSLRGDESARKEAADFYQKQFGKDKRAYILVRGIRMMLLVNDLTDEQRQSLLKAMEGLVARDRSAGAQLALALAYLRTRQADKALETLDKTSPTVQAHLPLAVLLRAWALRELNLPDEAKQQFERAAELVERHPDYTGASDDAVADWHQRLEARLLRRELK